jgi:hypothetical protein
VVEKVGQVRVAVIIAVISMLAILWCAEVMGGKSIKPDVEAPPPADPPQCLCMEIQDEDGAWMGTFCRCDVPGEGMRYVFEGTPDGLAELYLYLNKGLKQYYDELQKKRWPRAPEERGAQHGL